MKILLDTHAFIWFVEDNKSLTQSSKALIESSENEIFFSIASVWEMAIKIQLNKLKINKSIEEVIELVSINGFKLLPILPEHIIMLSTLQFHHRDPFDRIIIAQGMEERLSIVTKDQSFSDYKIDIIWGK